MSDPSGTKGLSRMQLTIDALKNLANTLKGHDGIVNVALIGFESTASTKYTINGLNASNVNDLIKAIEKLSANGGTNYEGAFDEALKWFNKQPTSSNGQTFENVTYFLTDGDPTFSNRGSNGGWGGWQHHQLLRHEGRRRQVQGPERQEHGTRHRHRHGCQRELPEVLRQLEHDWHRYGQDRGHQHHRRCRPAADRQHRQGPGRRAAGRLVQHRSGCGRQRHHQRWCR
ncbi:hypothetical protein AL520_30775 [Achromobacter xylosoxidans]|nr:hypothetical protein AL520_30775 [Achromobacter xylosoxidans]